MKRHALDIHPIPKEKASLYVNEPQLIDPSYSYLESLSDDMETEPDNVRIYVPLDLRSTCLARES